jgi:hypothetical protein
MSSSASFNFLSNPPPPPPPATEIMATSLLVLLPSVWQVEDLSILARRADGWGQFQQYAFSSLLISLFCKVNCC